MSGFFESFQLRVRQESRGWSVQVGACPVITGRPEGVVGRFLPREQRCFPRFTCRARTVTKWVKPLINGPSPAGVASADFSVAQPLLNGKSHENRRI